MSAAAGDIQATAKKPSDSDIKQSNDFPLFLLDSNFSAFVSGKENPLAETFSLFLQYCRGVCKTDVKTAHESDPNALSSKVTAENVLKTFSFLDYMLGLIEAAGRTSNTNLQPIMPIINKSKELLKKLIAIVALKLQSKLQMSHEINDFDFKDCFQAISADTACNDGVLALEAQWKETIETNKQAIKKLHDTLNKARSVLWPHPGEILRSIENAGLVRRMNFILIADRCACETCGVAHSGWHSWDNPWILHNFRLHPLEFLDRAIEKNIDSPQVLLFLTKLRKELNSDPKYLAERFELEKRELMLAESKLRDAQRNVRDAEAEVSAKQKTINKLSSLIIPAAGTGVTNPPTVSEGGATVTGAAAALVPAFNTATAGAAPTPAPVSAKDACNVTTKNEL